VPAVEVPAVEVPAVEVPAVEVPAVEVTLRCYVSFLLVAGPTRTQGVGDYTASLREDGGLLLITRLRVRILDEIVSDR
jgi:hypothetical protein